MTAKDIVLKPISRADADRIVKACHYSGRVVQNSQLHFGVFVGDKCGGAMQFGPSLDKRKIQGLVEGTRWNDFIELNRMAFADWLPKNSESRAISVAMRLIRKHYPNIEWVVSFADGAQCGDGTIYRASGFVLTSVKKNTTLWKGPDGHVIANVTITAGSKGKNSPPKSSTHIPASGGGASMKAYRLAGYAPMQGFQLRYIYFLNPKARERLTVPVLPFTEIDRLGAGMYRGKPKRAGSETSDTAGYQSAEGGSIPTPALQLPNGGQ